MPQFSYISCERIAGVHKRELDETIQFTFQIKQTMKYDYFFGWFIVVCLT